jgi:putative Ca2+/H+ antiporter (TMEM165/GDT1 family)
LYDAKRETTNTNKNCWQSDERRKKGLKMDWRVFLTTFGVIFLAEMGDKTQLAAMTMAAETKKPWAVFLGAALALASVSALGVLVGGVVGNYIPLIWIKRFAALAFIVIGILILLDKI